jgi:tetratricopeptide (TPR) repeat protein
MTGVWPLRTKILALSLIIIVAIAYANICGNEFTNWDDEHLLVRNKAIRSLDPIFVIRNFHLTYPPLIVISHSLDYEFWRLNPVGYHITDIMLYALIVLAFYFVCQSLIGDSVPAFIAASLFAVYPLHVESVAWLSSRKDGLAVLFYFLGFLAYLRTVRKGRRDFLWLSILFYFLALWSKPMMITLPLALILYDILLAPRRKSLCAIVVGKLPFAIPVALTCLAVVFLDPHSEVSLSYHGGSPYMTFLVVLRVLADYLRMLFFPVKLSVLYVVGIPQSLWEMPCPLSLAVGVGVLVTAAAVARRCPFFSFAVFWAFIALIPVLQIIPTNVVKADRYLYLPTAALCLLAGRLVASPALSYRRRGVVLVVVALLSVLMLLTIARNTVWKNSAALWESEVAIGNRSADVYNNLGIAYSRRGRYDEAEEAIEHSLELRPGFASAHNNLANVYRKTGRYDEALEELGNAIGLTKDIVYAANVYISMGMVYEAKGEYAAALRVYEKALKLSPVYMDDSMVRRRMTICRRKLAEGAHTHGADGGRSRF